MEMCPPATMTYTTLVVPAGCRSLIGQSPCSIAKSPILCRMTGDLTPASVHQPEAVQWRSAEEGRDDKR